MSNNLKTNPNPINSDNEELNEEHNNSLNSILGISPKVQMTIEQMLSTDDPLDRPDFNAVDYINGLFPSEQSLSNIDDVLNRMKQKIRF